VPEENALLGQLRERFETRARSLFYARLALMAVGLGVLAFPSWHKTIGLPLPLPTAAYVYLGVLAYQVASYLWVGKRFARPVLFASLCVDLLVVLYLVEASGGIRSPLMPTQLVFTMLFALLFPTPLAILPPLLTLPIIAKVDQILGTQRLPEDLLVVLFYIALNVTVVYVMVFLEGRERASLQTVAALQKERREVALTHERSRIAREIHDSVGASLSSVILQAEYLSSRVGEGEVRAEVEELREAARDGMEELRRAVSIMRKEFQLGSSLADYAAAFERRHRIPVRVEVQGVEPELEPDRQLALFRIAQEALSNVARHSGAASVGIGLKFDEHEALLEVKDDGRGFEEAAGKPGHYGLLGMRERATRVGGEVAIESAPGTGTRVAVRVPVSGPGE
jgi:two-component system, NarL family, sensor histidine kinase DegS